MTPRKQHYAKACFNKGKGRSLQYPPDGEYQTETVHPEASNVSPTQSGNRLSFDSLEDHPLPQKHQSSAGDIYTTTGDPVCEDNPSFYACPEPSQKELGKRRKPFASNEDLDNLCTPRDPETNQQGERGELNHDTAYLDSDSNEDFRFARGKPGYPADLETWTGSVSKRSHAESELRRKDFTVGNEIDPRSVACKREHCMIAPDAEIGFPRKRDKDRKRDEDRKRVNHERKTSKRRQSKSENQCEDAAVHRRLTPVDEIRIASLRKRLKKWTQNGKTRLEQHQHTVSAEVDRNPTCDADSAEQHVMAEDETGRNCTSKKLKKRKSKKKSKLVDGFVRAHATSQHRGIPNIDEARETTSNVPPRDHCEEKQRAQGDQIKSNKHASESGQQKNKSK